MQDRVHSFLKYVVQTSKVQPRLSASKEPLEISQKNGQILNTDKTWKVDPYLPTWNDTLKIAFSQQNISNS